MYKKRIISIILCTLLIATNTVFAIPQNIRQAGIVDDMQSLKNTYTYQNVQSKNGVTAKALPANIIYKMYSDIDDIFISISNGDIDQDFKVYTSGDDVNYEEISKTTDSGEFEFQGILQRIFYFTGMGQEQKYLKIELLNKESSIRNVFVNIDFSNHASLAMFKNITKEDSGSSVSERVITNDDMAIYKKRVVESLLSTNDVTSLAGSMNEDGSWPDIGYTGANGSTAYVHCERIENIAKSVGNPESPMYNNKEIIRKLSLAIEFWVDQNIKFSNWFQNEIRVPKSLGNTLLTAGNILPESTEEKAKEHLEGIVVSLLDPGLNDVGSNAVQIQMNRIWYALYINDLDRLKSAFDRIGEEVTIVNKLGSDNDWRNRLWTNYIKNVETLPDTREGIQVDYSCLFHGPLLYSGGYGLTFISEIADLMVAAKDTNLFPNEGINDLVDHVLEHYAYLVRGTTIDYSTIGRQIASNGNFVTSKNGASLYSTAQKLSQIDNIPRQEELAALYDSSIKKSNSTDGKNKHYEIVSVVANAEPQAENPAKGAVDGKLDTRWSSDGDGDNIISDLGEIKPIGAVAVAFHMGNARKTKFELAVSEDNKEWSIIYSGESSGLTMDLEYLKFTTVNARYIKLIGHGNTVNEWNSVSEIIAFETIDIINSEESKIEFVLLDEIKGVSRYYAVEEATIPTPAITGHKYYWKADYTAHPKDNFLMTVRTSSNRNLATEAVNTVSLKGDFLADGCTYIYRTGKEYEDIFAAWDWRKIPGTTTQIREITPIMVQHNAISGSNSNFAGGVTDNVNGATAMELVRDGISAKKSWFMFDNEFVALGTDIKNTTKNKAITTLNQTLLNGNVTVGKAGAESKVLEKGSNLDQSVNWVHHDNIGYVFNKGTNVSIENKEVEGDRVDINYEGLLSRPDKTSLVRKNIFSLWVDHTKDKTESYEYIVVPEITTSKLKAYAESNPINILSNKSELQAVENIDSNIMQAVFWTPGTVNMINGIQITVDKQVLVQTKITDNKLVFAIASLNAKEDTVSVKITKGLSGNEVEESDGITTFSVKLPNGDYAGQSVVLEFGIQQ